MKNLQFYNFFRKNSFLPSIWLWKKDQKDLKLIHGFLSYSLIKQGKTEEGINLAQQTLKDFDDSEEGKWLKENSYYTWAVWKSGIEIRTADHIGKTKDLNQMDVANSFLADAENILVMPDGNTEIFRLRLDELESTKLSVGGMSSEE